MGVRPPPSAGQERRAQLADFLRSRRAAVDPVGLGLPTERRRTPGLRREEVAMLAGVSVSWYTWLEQARKVSASTQVLKSISRALSLTPAEHAHLLTLAGPEPTGSAASHALLDDETVAIVHGLVPHVAYVLSPLLDVIAHNRTAELVMRDLLTRPEGERNMLRWLFDRSNGWDRRAAGWRSNARANLEDFRAGYPELINDPDARALVDELSNGDPTFRAWWAEHDVRDLPPSRKSILHSAFGPLSMLRIQTRLAHAPALRLRILVPEDDTTRTRLSELAAQD